ncbi:MAG: hypothetical protein C5B48_00740 [Candidatus Rokuibacteriota bacterium]|nr:MAG: hypothetical protein C5B48_00740 [Candidatus Rokubacteria bacterium]
MQAVDPTPADGSHGLHPELVHERLRSLHTINLVRFSGVTAFFALFLLLGGLLHLPAWTGNLGLFSIYWSVTAAVFWVSRRFTRVAHVTSLAIGLVDIPMVFLLQWATFPTSPSVSGVAGFTVGVYVLLVILAALSLERWYVFFTAAAGIAFEVLLQYLADVSVGAMVSTVILIGVTTVACSYARERLVALVGRVEATAQLDAARRHAENRLRETTGLLSIAQTLSGVTEVQEALRRICRELAHLMGAETAVAYLLDPARSELRPTAGYHVPKHLLQALRSTAVPLARLGSMAELEKTRVFWTDRVPDSPDFGVWLFSQVPHQSGLVVPLIVERQVAGAFYLVWWASRRAFDESELTLAEAVGQQVGRFIENAQLYEQLETSHQRSVQIERLRALGELAAGVAHDFNNLLTVVQGRAQLLLQTTDDPHTRRSLAIIVKATEDGARTVRRIQEFTRQTPPRPPEPLDLAAVVRDVVEMTRAAWKDQAEARGIHYEVAQQGGRVPPVLGDVSDLREALTNLVFNALDAMPQGGRLTVQLSTEGERARCDVIDTGAGMTRPVRERVFEPFFSTKPDQGSGLGLSVVHGIITRLGGEVSVNSAPGVGSTFTFWLPTTTQQSLPSPTAEASILERGARILLVEDDPQVRDALAEILMLDGHSVVACADGDSAVRRLEADIFDVVLTDLAMPGLGGWDVAKAVKERRPATPVGLITGWRDLLHPADAAQRGVDFVISKPFQIGDFRNALRQWLR